MWALHSHSDQDINIRGVLLHMFGDAMSSIGIIGGGLLIAKTRLLWIDPLLSVVIGAVIVWSARQIFFDSLNILLEGTPRSINRQEVRGALVEIEGVLDIHDLHIFTLSSNSHVLSCHVLIADLPLSSSNAILRNINNLLEQEFRICHTTIQFEHVLCEGADDISIDHSKKEMVSSRTLAK